MVIQIILNEESVNKKFCLFALGVVFSIGCATQPRIDPQLDKYMWQVKMELRKVWQALPKEKVKQVLDEEIAFAPKKKKIKTGVIFEVDHSGKIISSKIFKSSGLKVADDLAIEVIQQLPPLSVPPEKYYYGKETAAITWYFILEK
jgi:TonB family protein